MDGAGRVQFEIGAENVKKHYDYFSDEIIALTDTEPSGQAKSVIQLKEMQH